MTKKKETLTPEKIDQLLNELPAHARPTAAAARNAKIRMDRHLNDAATESKALKAHIRKLRFQHDLSFYRIGQLVDLSDTRVRQILGAKK